MSDTISSATPNAESSYNAGPRIVKLRKGTMLTWKSQLLTYLTARDLDHYVTDEIKEPKDVTELRTYRRNRARVMEAIQATIEIDDYNSISTTNPKEAFDSLIKDHGSQSGLLTAGVIAQISSLKLLPGASLDEFLAKVQSLHKELDSYVSEDPELRISSKILAVFLLNGLPISFDNIVQAFLNQMKTLNVSEAKIRLRMESARASDLLTATSLTVRVNNPSKSSNRRGIPIGPGPNDACNYPGHDRMFHTNSKCRTQHPELTKDDPEGLTIAQKAKKWEELQRTSSANTVTTPTPVVSTEATVAATTVDNFTPFDAFGYATAHSSSDNILLDTACSRHMVGNWKLFVSLKRIDAVPISGAFEGANSANFIGSVVIPGCQGDKQVNVIIDGVLYCPSLKANLLSIGQLGDGGCSFDGDDKMLTVKGLPGGTSITGIRSGTGLYTIQVSPQIPESCHLATADIWHSRLGHLNYSAIRHLQKEGHIKSTPVSMNQDSTCVVCQKSKITRRPFPSHFPIASLPLFRIHSDVKGPLPTSMGGASYIVSFIDDFSRYATVYIMKSKSDVLSCFDRYKKRVENLLEKKVKILRSDRGGEYMSNDFMEYLKSAGISFERAPADTPEHNSVAERFNRTLIERLRCILLDTSLPMKLWAEIAVATVYILNRSPNSTLQGHMPINKWISHIPGEGLDKANLSFLRVLGCQAIYLPPRSTSSGLSAKGVDGVHVGYEEGAKAYRIWNRSTNKITVCRNVIFNEHIFPYLSSPDTSTSIQYIQLDNLIDIDHSLDRPIDDVPAPPRLEVPAPDVHTPPPTSSRPSRQTQAPARLGNLVAHHTDNLCSDKPTYKQAMASSDAEEWKKAMTAKFQSLQDHDVGKLVPRPDHHRVIGGMWVLVRKRELGVITRYKARWVALGNHQVEGIDFKETYASVGRTDSFRLLIAIAAQMGCRVFSFDIITAFLHGVMKEKVYVRQVRGFEAVGQEDYVWELGKSLYGTRQGARDFSDHLQASLKNLGFNQSSADASLFILRKSSDLIFIHMHVDDGFVISTCNALVEEFKGGLQKTYEYKWREDPSSHLGIHLTYNEDRSIMIDQAHYLEDILEQFQMDGCNPVKTPFAPNTCLNQGTDEEVLAAKHLPYMSLIGSLMYAAICTRPDIMYAVGKLSQFNSCYTEHHWIAAKHVLRYLKASLHRGIKYNAKTDGTLRGYADAAYANDKDTRRSITGYLFTFGSSIFSWKSR